MTCVPDIDAGSIESEHNEPGWARTFCTEERAGNILDDYEQSKARRHVDEGSPTFCQEKKDPKILWAKAFWWATQEVRRRKLAKLRSERTGSGGGKGDKLWQAVKSSRALLRRSISGGGLSTSLSLNSVAPHDSSAHSEGLPQKQVRTLTQKSTVISPARLWRISTDRDPQPATQQGLHDLEQGFLDSPVPGTILSNNITQISPRKLWQRRDSLKSTGSLGSASDISESPTRCLSVHDASIRHHPSRQRTGSSESVAESLKLFQSELHINTPRQYENGKSHKTKPIEPKTFAERISRILNGKYYMLFSIACLLWVLGGREIYILGDPPLSADRQVYYLYVVCLLQLLLDLVLRSPFETRYFLGFYFWLDVSVFSMEIQAKK